MIVVITTSILAAMLVLLGKYEKSSNWYRNAFILVTFLACIHYNYGNDYNEYYLIWDTISTYSLFDIIISPQLPYGSKTLEAGWVILNAVFGFDGGFFYMVAFINIVEGWIYYTFIKRFVHAQSYFWSFFLYLFTFNYYLLNFSMMRQGLAMALILLSFIYLCDNNMKKMIVTIALAVSIHTSAVVIIPFLFLCKFIEKINMQWLSIAILFVFVLIYLSSGFTAYLFDMIISLRILEDYKYAYAGAVVEESMGAGFALSILPYITMFYFMIFKRNNLLKEDKCLIVLSCVALALKPLEFVGAQLIARIGFYFSVFDIAIVPIIYMKINNSIIRKLLYVSLLTTTVYSYFNSLNGPIYKDAFAEFHSIFELFQ